jgi:hypothetical protein
VVDEQSPDTATGSSVRPEIVPDGLQYGTQIKFDERAASAMFTKWSDRLERKGIDPATSRIYVHLAEEILSDRERLQALGLPDSGVEIPESILDAIATKKSQESK